MVTWLPGTHSWNLNGPVPTGCWLTPTLPYCLSAVGEIGASPEVATLFRNAPFGSLKTTVTTSSDLTSVCEYGPRAVIADRDFVSGLTMCSSVSCTACAVNGVPSWNLTSLRK